MTTGRTDQARITVHIEWPGLGDLGVWENRTGGEGGSEETKHKEGGMGANLSLGGSQTIENTTVARRYDLTRDHPRIGALYAARGKAEMTITEQPLDEFGNAFGDPKSWKGKLLTVTPPDRNANANDTAMMTLVQSTEGDLN